MRLSDIYTHPILTTHPYTHSPIHFTHIFSSPIHLPFTHTLTFHPYTYLSPIHSSLPQNGGRAVALRSGLYALKDGKKPPIDVTAVAIQNEEGVVYVAMTINVIKGINSVKDPLTKVVRQSPHAHFSISQSTMLSLSIQSTLMSTHPLNPLSTPAQPIFSTQLTTHPLPQLNPLSIHFLTPPQLNPSHPILSPFTGRHAGRGVRHQARGGHHPRQRRPPPPKELLHRTETRARAHARTRARARGRVDVEPYPQVLSEVSSITRRGPRYQQQYQRSTPLDPPFTHPGHTPVVW